MNTLRLSSVLLNQGRYGGTRLGNFLNKTYKSSRPLTTGKMGSFAGKTFVRPLSPHLTIYQIQLTTAMSIGHRISGAGLSALVYAFAIGYAVVQPGAIVEELIQRVSEVPTVLVGIVKFGLATPFFFHSFNGVRHLIWDAGLALSLKATYTGGWIVNAATVIAAGIVSFLL